MSERDSSLQNGDVTVRNAVLDDAEDIAKIAATTFTDSFAHSMPAKDMDEYLQSTLTTERIAEQIHASAENQFFVATSKNEQDDRIIGFIQMKSGSTEPCIPHDACVCEVHRIYISSGQTNAGVGQKLMDRGLEWAHAKLHAKSVETSHGQRGIWLGVWDENFRAQRFYSRFGFEKIGEHDFIMGETTQTDHVMIKWL